MKFNPNASRSEPSAMRGVRRTRGIAARFLVALVFGLLWLSGCARPEPTLVVVVGGLGLSQLGDLRHAVERQCPEAKVVNAGGWDGYKADIEAIATAKPHEHIILVGHSFGCQAIAKAAAKLKRVDLTVFIDPAWDDFRLSKNVDRALWYKRSNFDIEKEAWITGPISPKTIQGDHNSIPHSPELIAEVVRTIKGIDNRQTASADMGHP